MRNICYFLKICYNSTKNCDRIMKILNEILKLRNGIYYTIIQNQLYNAVNYPGNILCFIYFYLFHFIFIYFCKINMNHICVCPFIQNILFYILLKSSLDKQFFKCWNNVAFKSNNLICHKIFIRLWHNYQIYK